MTCHQQQPFFFLTLINMIILVFYSLLHPGEKFLSSSEYAAPF